MEWMNRAGRPAQHAGQTVTPTAAPSSAGGTHHTNGNKRSTKKTFGAHHVFSGLLFFSIAVLAAALVGFFLFYKQNTEGKYVAEDKMQAVFLNGGQVYFGKIRALNDKYVGVTDIYYLRVNQQVQPKQGEQAQQDISLVKLGCELHGPQDQMFINREQVVFWENLKTDGQVAKAVEAYKKQNPDGQKCEANQQTPQSGNGQPQENAENKEEN